MSQLNSEEWFTEVCQDNGSAFSFQIKQKLHAEKTPFQTIEIYETTHFGNLMVIDGFVMLTTRDNFLYHEMMSHTALFAHPCPKQVLIIGGGDCGTLREVLKHPGVESVVQVDIDEQVTRLSERYFPELCESNKDPRASLYFDDGIKWVKEAEAASIDLIIVDSTDPIGPAEGLFTKEFYTDCYKALKPDGLLIGQSESPLYHQKLIQDMKQAMRGAGLEKTKNSFFPATLLPFRLVERHDGK